MIIKDELKLLKEENVQIKNKLKNIEEFLGKISLKDINVKEMYFDFDKSYIIKNEKEKEALKNWISSIGTISNINLLYKASKDGDDLISFYEKCENKGATISLIQTTKGRRFGGFSRAEWILPKNDYMNYKDTTAFLFSLDDLKKYKILRPEYAIACYHFGDFLVYGNNNDYKGIFLTNDFNGFRGSENLSSRVYDVSSDFCLSGEDKFSIEEVEVFQIIFE